MKEITKRTIDEYKNYLVEEEKCSVTIKKISVTSLHL